MAWAIVDHFIQGSADTNGFTSGSRDTTGTDLVVVSVAAGNTSGGVISDSKSNAWTQIVQGTAFGVPCTIWYCPTPTVGTGHTFSVSGTGNSPSVQVVAFSGSVASPLDQSNSGGGGFSASGQPGSITPTQNGELLVTAMGSNTSGTYTIDSSFTIIDQATLVTAQHFGLGVAYLIQTSASAVNPTWSESGGQITGIVIASFRVAATAAAQTPYQPWLQRASILAQ